MSKNILQAEAMGVATLGDPQFRLPHHPVLTRGLVSVHTEHGLLVEGGPSRQLLGGGASAALQTLWDAMDGRRTVIELARDTGLSQRSVHSIASLLYTSGLLEEAEQSPDVTGFNEHALDFLSRSVDSTRVNLSGAHAATRLSQSRIAIVTDQAHSALAQSVHASLSTNGYGQVSQAMYQIPEGTTLVLALGVTAQVEALTEQANAQQIPVLPAQMLGANLYYGPQLHPDYSLSFQDLARQIASEPWDHPEPSLQELAAELLCGELSTLSSRVGQTMALQSLVCVDLNKMTQRRLVAVRSTSDGIPLAYAFESSTEFAPRHLSSPKDHQVHYKSTNLELAAQSIAWPSAPTIPFDSAPATPGVLDVQALSWLVRACCGNRPTDVDAPGRVQRYAPTGGNLGSVQAYLVVREVPGLAPGGYGFQRRDNTLATLPWVDPDLALGGFDTQAAASVVFTAALNRVATKYSAFGWRIIHLDAGVAGAHLMAVAQDQQLRLQAAASWDDQALGELLGIDTDSEPVTSVFNLYPTVMEGRTR